MDQEWEPLPTSASTAGIASLAAPTPTTSTDVSVRDALAAALRAQYNTGAGGSGSWDDAGYDRAKELADLMVKAGVTNLGDLSFKNLEGDIWSAGMDDQGNALPGEWSTGTLGRQLMIGDKAVGYLGDYNNDGTYGSKAGDVLQGIGDEALLGWSARGDGNTSYRVITDPTTGKLVIAPGWNSSSDASDFRKAGVFLGGAALGGGGISGSLAGAAGLTGGAGAALSGAATGAGLNMATTQKIDENTLKAGAIGGLGGYLGHAAGGMFTDAPTELTGWDAAMADAAKSGAITPEWMAGGSGVNLAGADAWDDVMRAGVDTSYTGQTMPWDLPMDDPNWQPNPADYSAPSTPSTFPGQSVEVTAPRLPTPINPGGAIGAGIGATLPSTITPSDGDAPTGQNDPNNDNLDEGGTGPSTIPPATDWSSAIKDWVLKNPKLAMTLAGSLLGGGGSNTPAPAAPGTGPQAGFTATPAPSLGRQYVAPPPGYRPGFDPEHRYFTGIGTTGTGG
jgi:hypothetical protein